jgi:hypothetical protein
MICNPESTTRATPATKLARQEVQAKLLPLEVDEAADITGVSRSTVLRDRRELELKSLANLSGETEQYWQEEMTRIMSDVEYLREKAKRTGLDNLLLATLDRWLKLVDMNIIKRSISATVDLTTQAWPNRLSLATRGIVAEERRNEVIAMLEAWPRDENLFPTVGRKILEGVISE